jgi:hypothetical protein
MSDIHAQIRFLLQRAGELRAESQEIQRKLMDIFAQLAKLKARQANEGKLPPREWRTGPDKPRNPNSQNE